MPPLWVQIWCFQNFRFYCLICGNLKKVKKRKEGRRVIKGKKEGIKQERRKEEECVKNIIKKIIRNYLKKKKPPAGFKVARPVFVVFLAAAGSVGLV